MTTPTKIEDIMRFLDKDESSAKTASVAQPAAPAAPPAMQAALSDVMASIGQAKTASAAPAATPDAAPVTDLVKMANDIVAIDRDGEVKHAQLVGAAMADAFVARINQWDGAAGSSKTASDDAQLAKFASENPDAYKLAVSQGYTDAKALIEKVGNDLYTKTFNNEVVEIQKTAAEHFVHGWNAIQEADRLMSQQAR